MKVIKKIVVPRVSTHWEILGAYLITSDEESDRKYTGDSKYCCTTVLEEWISSSRGVNPKTYTKLLEVISEIPEVAAFAKIIKQCLENEGIYIGMYIVANKIYMDNME